MTEMRSFTFGIFPIPGRKTFTVYSIWYNPAWQGCCEHTVEAENAKEARLKAIAAHKDLCLTQRATEVP